MESIILTRVVSIPVEQRWRIKGIDFALLVLCNGQVCLNTDLLDLLLLE